jgi:mannosyltransferase
LQTVRTPGAGEPHFRIGAGRKDGANHPEQDISGDRMQTLRLNASPRGSWSARAFTRDHFLDAVLLTGVTLLGLALRLYRIDDERLWLDEVWGATCSAQSILDCLIFTLRFDVHPPFYYFQLNLWATPSHSLTWLYLNSVLWSTSSVVALFLCLRRLASRQTTFAATLFLAAMPVGIEMAHNLRMYPLLTVFAVLAWYYSEQVVIQPERRRNGLLLVTFILLAAYSHALGILILGPVGIYGFCRMAQERESLARFRWWLKLNFVAGLLSLPAVAISVVRSVTHPVVPNAAVVLRTMSYLIAGPVAPLFWPLATAALGLFLTAMVFSPEKRLRTTLFAFGLVPPIIAVVLSYAVRPIWLERTLFLTIPFLALGMAEGIVVVAGAIRRDPPVLLARGIAAGAVVIFAIGLGTAAVKTAQLDVKPTDFRAAAADIRAGLAPGDVIYIPNNVTFWGIARYLIGADWGSPLAVQDSDPVNYSDRWNQVLHWLGPRWRARLRLEPTTRSIAYGKNQMIVGWSVPPEVATTKRIWLVNQVSAGHAYMVLDRFVERQRTEHRGLSVQLLVPAIPEPPTTKQP